LPPGERDSLLTKIETCDQEADAARQNRNTHELLAQLETGLHLRRRLYKETSQEVLEACQELCKACNVAGTNALQQGKLEQAIELLKRAEQVADRSDADRAITWNNMACYYRKANKPRAAQTLLERALAIEEHTGSPEAAQTHLNLCATLSQMQKHGEAIQHAQSALILMYEIISPMLFEGRIQPGAVSDDAKERLTVLCIAYHNLAVEHEHMKNAQAAANAYREGVKWASQFLGEPHQLVGILQNGLEAVAAKLPANSGVARRANKTKEQAMGHGQSERYQQLEGLMTPRDAQSGEFES